MVTELVIDFGEEAEKQTLWNALRRLRGQHRITIKAYRKRRSDQQNRYYWPCFCQPLADFLSEQGEYTTADQAHEILKSQFLKVTIEDEKAGLLEFTQSTAGLSVDEFNEYLDRCSHWLFEMFGITVPEPEVYHLQGE